jgi:hypothetical protein
VERRAGTKGNAGQLAKGSALDIPCAQA